MKAAIYIGNESLVHEPSYVRMVSELEAGGWVTYMVKDREEISEDTNMLISVGGDGTFLSASSLVAYTGLPLLGVNMGRLGFLSENRPEDVSQALLSGDYTIENRTMLSACSADCSDMPESCTSALNEMAVHRSGPSMLEVDVSVDGVRLPTYWADGLVISTSSGSTAYSLSVGGPIVLPEARVLIISPIAPHNLNVRPLVVPDTAEIALKMSSRDLDFVFSADNRSVTMKSESSIKVSVAQFSLKRVRLNRSNFINALTQKLFWGEDVRNIK